MIKHIVLWRLKDEADGHTKAENIERMRAAIEAMRELVPGIRHLEVGVGFGSSNADWDVALYSEFGTLEELDGYQVDPEHEKVKRLVSELALDRAVADYEV